MKSHHLCSHLIFLYIIGYNNISWRPHNPHATPSSKNLGVVNPNLQGLTPMTQIDKYKVEKGASFYIDCCTLLHYVNNYKPVRVELYTIHSSTARFHLFGE